MLPILGAILLLNVIASQVQKGVTPMNCENNCKSDCSNHCYLSCYEIYCKGSCTNTCLHRVSVIYTCWHRCESTNELSIKDTIEK